MRKKQPDRCLCLHGLENAEKITRVIHLIMQGISESEACQREQIDKNWFRRFVRANIDKTQNANEIFPDVNDWYCWQDRFLKALVGKDTYAPEGFDRIYESVTEEALNERQREVLRLRFQEEQTLLEISKQFQVTKECIRQTELHAIRILRHPKYRMPLLYGSEYEAVLSDCATVQQKYDHEKVQLMKEVEKERKSFLEKMQKETTLFYESCLETEKENASKKIETVNDFIRSLDSVSINELHLSNRSYHALTSRIELDEYGRIRERERIDTVGKLLRLKQDDLYQIRNLGTGSVKEIVDKVYKKYGFQIPSKK